MKTNKYNLHLEIMEGNTDVIMEMFKEGKRQRREQTRKFHPRPFKSKSVYSRKSKHRKGYENQ